MKKSAKKKRGKWNVAPFSKKAKKSLKRSRKG